MNSPYKRRRPSLVRNFWIYRRLVGLAFILGLILWFVWANDTEVIVSFPFHLWTVKSKAGILILVSALVGSLVTAFGMTLVLALRQIQSTSGRTPDDAPNSLPDDRPPPGYAAKASESVPDDELD